jgi:hypothetical protein
MPATKPACTEEFKRDVLAYQASTKENQRQTASHFGITTATESPEQELRRLRRENRALQMRCEILKKTVSIFSDQNPSVSP